MYSSRLAVRGLVVWQWSAIARSAMVPKSSRRTPIAASPAGRPSRRFRSAMKPLARLGYMDYSVLNREAVFEMQRPVAQPDGSLKTPSGPWDGVYR